VPAAYGSWQAITSDSAKEPSMTTSTGTASTATLTDVDVVHAVFGAFASGDLAALSDLLHPGATWHHHNNDRLGGIHRGAEAVIAYLTESALLTAGTLHAEPQSVMADGDGHVAVLVRLSASRPDGRSMDGPQVLLVTVEDSRVRAIEQFVGDPAAVAAFWA
jgi:ketosteroid isomerase-like protein